MIPIKDTIPSRTYPIVTISLIAVNSVLFLYEISLGPNLGEFISDYSVIPEKYFHLAVVDKWNLVDRFLPLFTSIFLHGGWFHLIGNMIYLWVFGDNMEDMMGHTKYLIFYLLCGLGAGYAHLYTNVSSPMPTIGASGAVAGVMGAYFVLFPRSKVWTLFPIFFFVQIVQIPAFALLGFWFLMQFFMGFFSLGISPALGGGVAWWAHIGGFACGALLVFVFKKRICVRCAH
jgi:membrane associated rhomboid family serine protease